MKKTVSSLEKNKLLFYVVVAIAFVNIFVFASKQDWNPIIVLVLAAIVAYFFKVGKTLSLLIAIICSLLFRAGTRMQEGMGTERPTNASKPKVTPTDPVALKDNVPPVDNHPGALQRDDPTPSKLKPTRPGFAPAASMGATATPSPHESPTSANKITAGHSATMSTATPVKDDDNKKALEGLTSITSTAHELMGRQDQLHKLAKQLGPLMKQASKMMKQLPDGFLQNALKNKT